MAKGLEVFDIFGAEYYVDWRRVTRGASFFLPTTATARQVRKILTPICKELDIEVTVRQRCEYGMYGVRVWRTL
ncbi:MAG: hypothetical protein ABFD96_13270 [Armatimonadia bacterium]